MSAHVSQLSMPFPSHHAASSSSSSTRPLIQNSKSIRAIGYNGYRWLRKDAWAADLTTIGSDKLWRYPDVNLNDPPKDRDSVSASHQN